MQNSNNKVLDYGNKLINGINKSLETFKDSTGIHYKKLYEYIAQARTEAKDEMQSDLEIEQNVINEEISSYLANAQKRIQEEAWYLERSKSFIDTSLSNIPELSISFDYLDPNSSSESSKNSDSDNSRNATITIYGIYLSNTNELKINKVFDSSFDITKDDNENSVYAYFMDENMQYFPTIVHELTHAFNEQIQLNKILKIFNSYDILFNKKRILSKSVQIMENAEKDQILLKSEYNSMQFIEQLQSLYNIKLKSNHQLITDNVTYNKKINDIFVQLKQLFYDIKIDEKTKIFKLYDDVIFPIKENISQGDKHIKILRKIFNINSKAYKNDIEVLHEVGPIIQEYVVCGRGEELQKMLLDGFHEAFELNVNAKDKANSEKVITDALRLLEIICIKQRDISSLFLNDEQIKGYNNLLNHIKQISQNKTYILEIDKNLNEEMKFSEEEEKKKYEDKYLTKSEKRALEIGLSEGKINMRDALYSVNSGKIDELLRIFDEAKNIVNEVKLGNLDVRDKINQQHGERILNIFNEIAIEQLDMIAQSISRHNSQLNSGTSADMNTNMAYLSANKHIQGKQADVVLISEDDHVQQHNSNVQKLIERIQANEIEKDTVIALERKQDGNNFGMSDVVVLAKIMRYNDTASSPDSHLIIPPHIRQSPIYKDAELYNVASEYGITVVGLEAKETKRSIEDSKGKPQLNNENSKSKNQRREDNMVNAIQQIKESGKNVIAIVGSAHIDNLESKIKQSKLKIQQQNNTIFIDKNTQHKERVNKSLLWSEKVSNNSSSKSSVIIKR